MPGIIDPKTGRVIHEGEPGYLEAKVKSLEGTIGELLRAVVDLQHRLAALDGGPVDWPGDT